MGLMMTRETIRVDMTSKAIDARLRDVAQLRKLGLSIASAKPIPALEFFLAESPAASAPVRCEPATAVKRKVPS